MQRKRQTLNPLPTTLEDALQEIFALQQQLRSQNERHARIVEEYAVTIKSLKGTLKKLRRQMDNRLEL